MKETFQPIPCIDKITEVEKGKVLRAYKMVRPDEEHFDDHFVNFPIQPGALMLEGLSQLSTWHVRLLEDFSRSHVRMIACSQAKFVNLVKPNDRIEYESQLTESKDFTYDFATKVSVNGKMVASAKITLESQPITHISPLHSHLEPQMNSKFRHLFNSLTS